MKKHIFSESAAESGYPPLGKYGMIRFAHQAVLAEGRVVLIGCLHIRQAIVTVVFIGNACTLLDVIIFHYSNPP